MGKKRNTMRLLFQALITWVVGNLVWGIAIYAFTKVVKDVPMIEAIGAVGFLVLIVVGVVTVNRYLLFREKQVPITNMQLENMARYITMTLMAQQYNIKPGDLSDLGNPQAMEERARRLQTEKELSDLRAANKREER